MLLRRLPWLVFRFAFVWVVDALSILVAASLPIGIRIVATEGATPLGVAFSVALVIGLLNLVVRPLLILLTLPLNVLTVGLLTIPINAIILVLTSWLIRDFEVPGPLAALAGSLLVSIVNTILTGLTTIDDDYAFYQGVTEWYSRRERVAATDNRERGIVVVEIDGLSYPRLLAAIRQGYMPTLRAMLAGGEYAVSRVDCGLPSQTSSCQSGILFGDNHDIPAFRWYDKANQRLVVSNNLADVRLLNERLSQGHGLLRGGSSVGNMVAGDAMKSVLTMATMEPRTADEARWRDEDLYLFFLNPYVLTRSLLLTLFDIARELWQATRDRLTDRQPRINRLQKAFPAVRAVTNIFIRDLNSFIVVLDIVRAMPAIYTSLIGYDEVAHHAGPDASDAYQTLTGIDAAIGRIQDVIARKAGRPYDLFILSDHGQSFGATFAQRYGLTLAEVVQDAAGEASVQTSSGGRADEGSTLALISELRRVGAPRGGVMRRATMNRALSALERRVEPPETLEALPGVDHTPSPHDDIHVTVSGNLAHVYLPSAPGKVSLNEIHAAYPGMVDYLVRHPGVGFVVGYDEGCPVALGKSGARDLQNSIVTGDDPLAAYGPPQLRAAQVRRLADFPSAGDLIINSTVYPDGTVAAFEELIGSHGGLGGQQTEAFICHPADMEIRPTTNATEVFPQLDARRGLPKPPPAVAPQVDPWDLASLALGLARWRTWLPLAIGAATFNPAAYRRVARDPYLTGPAMLLAALGLLLSTIVTGSLAQRFVAAALPWGFIPLVLGIEVFVAYLAGRMLRGKATATQTFRAVAFAQVTAIYSLLTLLPEIGHLLAVVVPFLGIVAVWIAGVEAMQLKRSRALIYPIVGVALFVIAVVLSVFMLNSLGITIEAFEQLLRLR